MSFKSFVKKHTFLNIMALILLPMLLLIQLLSCSFPKPQPAGNSTVPVLNIVTSIIPAGEFIKKIGAERVYVSVMVPQGADPHTYEPTPGQLRELSGADIYAKIGSGLEFEIAWLDRLVSVNPGIYMLDLSEGVIPIYEDYIAENQSNGLSEKTDSLQEGNITDTILSENTQESDKESSFKRGADPHIWLSPKNVKIISKNISLALSAIDTGGKELYDKNLDIFNSELDELDKKIRESLSNKINKKFIVYHPAWAYFAKDYGLNQVTVEHQGKEPTAREIAAVIALAKENGIKVIFASPQFNPKSAEVIAKEIGGTVVFIDPLGLDYMKNMEIVLESLTKYLQ